MRRLAGIAAVLVAASAAVGGDWLQVAANPARTGHTPDEPKAPYELAWAKRWGEEIITNTNQPILVGGVVYAASNNGVVHAVVAATGKDLWAEDIGAPVTHALASDGQRVFAAALDGAVHALDRTTGKAAWRTKLSRRGFSAAPLLMGGRIFIGNRDGVFYALEAATGRSVWQRDTGAPIRQTAAGAKGSVVFVNDAMKAFRLDAAGGEVLWSTPPLPGGSVRDYWPVIYRDRIIIRTCEAGARDLIHLPRTLQERFEKASFKAKTVDDVVGREQDMLVAYFKEFPFVRTFIVLNLSDGAEPYTAGVYGGCSNTGTYAPPCVGGDGNLYTMCRTSAARAGFVNITHLYLGRFDVETGRMAKPILCGWREVGTALFGIESIRQTSPWKMISDETAAISAGGDLIFGMRNDHSAGAIHVKSRRQAPLPGFEAITRNDMQPSANMLSIAGKYITYAACGRYVVCIRGH